MAPILPLKSIEMDRIGMWKRWFLRREENRSIRRKTSRSRKENQQQTQPTYCVQSGETSRATSVARRRVLSLLRHPCILNKERLFFVKVLQIIGQKLFSICCYLLLNKKVNLNLYFVQPQNHNESVYDSSPSFLRPGRLQWT